MPVHDWDRVNAGIFHDFHHAWIETIKRALNDGLLPGDFYALAEQQGAGFQPDLLTLQATLPENGSAPTGGGPNRGGEPHADGVVVLTGPRTTFQAEADFAADRRKQNRIAVRHASDDRLIAVIEIVSKGNKSGRAAIEDFVRKAAELLAQGIHLLVVDLQAPTARDPRGIHGVIWEFLTDDATFTPPAGKTLTLASYEADPGVRAFIEPVGIGDALPEMPLFLRSQAYVPIPLEKTYNEAFEAVPRRWREVLEPRR